MLAMRVVRVLVHGWCMIGAPVVLLFGCFNATLGVTLVTEFMERSYERFCEGYMLLSLVLCRKQLFGESSNWRYGALKTIASIHKGGHARLALGELFTFCFLVPVRVSQR